MPQNVYLKQKIYVHKSLDFWVHFNDLDILNSGPPLHYVAYLGRLSAYISNKTKVPLVHEPGQRLTCFDEANVICVQLNAIQAEVWAEIRAKTLARNTGENTRSSAPLI